MVTINFLNSHQLRNMTKQRSRNIHSIYPLYRLANILGIFPTINSKYLYTFYAILWVLLTIGLNTLALIGRWRESYTVFTVNTLILTDIALNLSVTIANISTILAPSCIFLKDFLLFVEVVTKSDILKRDAETMKKCRGFYVELALGHFALLALFVYDAYVWTTTAGFDKFRHYIFRDVQNYHLFVAVMVIYNFAVLMRHRFEGINEALRKVASSSKPVNEGVLELVVKVDTEHTVRYISQLYETQITQIALFNKIFGWQILFMTLATMMGLLNSLNLMVAYAIQTGSIGYNLILLSIFWALWQVILGIVISASCNDTTNEALVTADLCFTILIRLPVSIERPQEKVLREELTALSQMALHRCPTFSAVGFFILDNSLLLAMFGSVTSYIIVLIQFTK